MSNNKLQLVNRFAKGSLIRNFIVTCKDQINRKYQIGWQDHEWNEARFLKAVSQSIKGPITVIKVHKCKHKAEYNEWHDTI